MELATSQILDLVVGLTNLTKRLIKRRVGFATILFHQAFDPSHFDGDRKPLFQLPALGVLVKTLSC